MLRYGIPDFKLEKHVLDDWLERLAALADRVPREHARRRRGEPITVDGLLADGYDAVFLGHGASDRQSDLEVEGGDLTGVYQATEFLSRGNLPPDAPPGVDARRRCTLVAASSSSAAVTHRWTARAPPSASARREVTLVYRRTEKEMVGREEERQHAREEGVRFEFLCAPVRFLGTGSGRVRGVELQRMELGPPDESGRRRPQPVDGSDFTLEADTVVLAIGYNVDDEVPASAAGVACDKWGVVTIDRETGETDRPGVFAGGDNVNGADLVVTAIRDAKIAAEAMLAYLAALDAGRARASAPPAEHRHSALLLPAALRYDRIALATRCIDVKGARTHGQRRSGPGSARFYAEEREQPGSDAVGPAWQARRPLLLSRSTSRRFCTTEACAYRDDTSLFEEKGAQIFGISRDSTFDAQGVQGEGEPSVQPPRRHEGRRREALRLLERGRRHRRAPDRRHRQGRQDHVRRAQRPGQIRDQKKALAALG